MKKRFQMIKIRNKRENILTDATEIFFKKKLEKPMEYYMQEDGLNKGQKWRTHTEAEDNKERQSKSSQA